jgi:AraC-like DNA-binding protein
MERHPSLDSKLWVTEKGHKKGAKRALFAPSMVSITPLERMAGTTRLELATSAVTVLQRLTTTRGLPKYPQVVQDILFCGLGCGSRLRVKFLSRLPTIHPLICNVRPSEASLFNFAGTIPLSDFFGILCFPYCSDLCNCMLIESDTIGSQEITMASRIHQVELHRPIIAGIQAMTLVSNYHFPRHSHDQFGIGVIAFGAQRSWSGVGAVNASAGDVIMVNPGEIHDGLPSEGNARGWRMIYFDPDVFVREVGEEIVGQVEIVRPVARDPLLVMHFAKLFACLTDSQSDPLARDESLLRSLIYMVRQHATPRRSPSGPPAYVAKAIQRLDSAPETPASLAELAALSGVSRFQLLRGFAHEVGVTPHAYLVQRRVCLARRLLAVGQTPAQAAVQAGFADQSHMTRAFVRQFGITPGRYQSAVA